MKIVKFLSIFFCVASSALAQQAPWGRPDIPISSRDRVYTADQTSNTVSVIDPSTNRLLGVIKLGDPVPGALSPLYKGQLLVHGLGHSPDSKTLAVVSIGSNSVTLIDTATNQVKGTVYVGRSPHEAFFTPDGRELWVTVRGENYVSVIDPAEMKEIRRTAPWHQSRHNIARTRRPVPRSWAGPGPVYGWNHGLLEPGGRAIRPRAVQAKSTEARSTEC